MGTQSVKLRKVSIAITIVFVMLLSGCSKPNPPPVPIMPSPVPRPLIAMDIEIDTPPLYNLGHSVALAVANKIDEMATRVNSNGMVIFVCLISSRSFEDCPVNFKTPPISAWVQPPSLPHYGSDPYKNSVLKTAYEKALAAWQVIHAGQLNTLAHVTAWVRSQTDRIRSSIQFRWDDKGSDIFGALATGSVNLNLPGVTNATKYMLLASDFISTTTVQDVGSFSLAGVRVAAIYRTCSDNKSCQDSNSYWSSVVRSAGGLSFNVYSPAQSQALGLQLPV